MHYLRRNQYTEGISKDDKANLRRKCKNFKFDCGVLYFKRVKKGEGEGDGEGWKICVRTEGEKRRLYLGESLATMTPVQLNVTRSPP